MRFAEALQKGHDIEDQARIWLNEDGFYVIPTTDIRSGRQRAPSLEGRADSIVLPDLQVYAHGIQRWVEVKGKSQATFHRGTKMWEHGIELAKWHAYLKCELVSGVKGWLCVIEQNPTPLILLAPLDRLEVSKRVYLGSNMPGGKPHIFFPRFRFDVYAGPSERVELAPPRSPRTIKDGLPEPQLTLFREGLAD